MNPDSPTRVLVTPEDLIGFEIDGRYRLDAIVGGGGMGVVYRTTQQNLNREIAIKLLKLDDADGNKNRVERFKREIDIIAQLSHPNIVRVFDSGQDPTLGLHYIAMELVVGAALDELMHGTRLLPELAIDIAHEIAAALTEPHRMGIVHRDIKPANVLLSVRSDDTIGVKVVDFGIARGGSAGSSKITTTGVVVGSPMYMAPEVARGESMDGRTDLYSLGVLLYEMLTGDTPFRGSTPVAIMLRHAVEEPPSLAESVGPSFAIPELVELVDQLLSKERKDRPEDAKAVLRSLEEIRSRHGMTRVRIDGSKPLREAIAKFVVVELSTDSIDMANPFTATTPVEIGEEGPGSDSFSGWLVSDAARRALTHPGLEAQNVSPSRPVEPPKRGAGAIAATLVVVAASLVGLILLLTAPDKPVNGAVELGTPTDLVEPQAPAPELLAAAAPDTGSTAPDSAPDDKADDKPDLGAPVAPEKPAAKPNRETQTAAPSKKDDDVDKGLKWLDKK